MFLFEGYRVFLTFLNESCTLCVFSSIVVVVRKRVDLHFGNVAGGKLCNFQANANFDKRPVAYQVPSKIQSSQLESSSVHARRSHDTPLPVMWIAYSFAVCLL